VRWKDELWGERGFLPIWGAREVLCSDGAVSRWKEMVAMDMFDLDVAGFD
jgi:hypothetical protein